MLQNFLVFEAFQTSFEAVLLVDTGFGSCSDMDFGLMGSERWGCLGSQ